MSAQKRYATIHNPTIQAVVSEMYRFATEAEARAQMETLSHHFIASRQQIRNKKHPSLHLWIKDYALSEEDKANGFKGHFAIISYKQAEGRFSLYATKLDVPLNEHPQRTQPKRDNPNWGHPVLRSLRKGKTYATPEAAQAELDVLHRDFPKVSIPNPGKLYIMIYCADRPAKQRMVKHVVKIAASPEGGFHLTAEENKPKAPRSQPKVDTPPPARLFYGETGTRPEAEAKEAALERRG